MMKSLLTSRVGLTWWLCVAWANAVPTVAQSAVDTPPRTVVVHPLFYAKTATGAVGSCHPLAITAGLSSRQPFRIGFFESEVDGSGDQWRAAGWMASVVAAQITGFDPRTMHVSFDTTGRTDGPSVGGLMTVGILAATRGDEVRDDVAMTGTINPDGTLGPVGGIPHKIAGAAKAGKKLVLIPAGIRSQFDTNKKETVDLLSVGKELGVEVLPVPDVYAAYKVITGVDLPRCPEAPRPGAATEHDQLLKAQIEQWRRRQMITAGLFGAFGDDLKSDYNLELVEDSNDLLASGGQLLGEGQIIAASNDIVYGTLMARWAFENGRFNDVYQQQGKEALVKHILSTNDVEKKVQETVNKFRASKPKTLDQLATQLYGYELIADALSLNSLATWSLANLPKDEEVADEQIYTAGEYLETAKVRLLMAEDTLEWADAMGGPELPANARLLDAAAFYRRASDANFNVFEEIVIEDMFVSALDMPVAAIKISLIWKDEDYAMLWAARKHSRRQLPQYFGNDMDAYILANLAASISEFTNAASLMAKYYSFQAKLDENLDIEAIGREQSLAEALEATESEARRRIAFLRSNGLGADLCVAFYESGRIESGRGAADRVTALTDYWYATIYADLIAWMGGLHEKGG